MPRTRRDLPLIQLLPNLMTLAALCCGLTAIRLAFLGRIEGAVALILLAALLDGLDGRLARALKSESALGAELDSLADFLNFGVAPAFVLFVGVFGLTYTPGWIAVLIYALCCVLRLARFNLEAKAGQEAPKGFAGVPSPAGALLVLAPVYLSLAAPDLALPPLAVAAHAVVVGALLVSPWPTPSLKHARVPKALVRPLLLGFVLLGLALLTWPWPALIALSAAYLALVLGGWGRRLIRKTEGG
jgi:CDP-diacylglycerol---serine O-phosphatidyltransferase